MNDRGKTVVFIHGLWLHATSVPNWAGLFEQSRSTPLAPGWPGEPLRRRVRWAPEVVAGKGIEEVTDHFRRLIDGLASAPIPAGN